MVSPARLVTILIFAIGLVGSACTSPETTSPGQPVASNANSTPTPLPTATATPTPIPTPTPTPLPSAEALIQRAAERLAQVRSVALQVDGNGTPIEIGSGMKVDKFSATVLRPDRVKLKAQSAFGANTIELELIKVGSQVYLRNPFGQRWQALPPGSSPLESIDPFAAADVFKKASSATRLGRETLGGADTWLVRVEIQPDALVTLLGARLSEDSISADLWIGAQDALLRQVSLKTKTSASSSQNVMIRLSDFDAPITIDPPQ